MSVASAELHAHREVIVYLIGHDELPAALLLRDERERHGRAVAEFGKECDEGRASRGAA
jgi:hypothetical protein